MAIESKNLLVAIKAYSRGNALPLDASEVYASVPEAKAYAKSAIAYGGQTIKALVDGKYKTYTLQPSEAGYVLEEVGAISPLDLKQYVQIVDRLPELGQEQGVIYIVGTTGQIWTGSAWKIVFKEISAQVDELESKVTNLETEMSKKAPLDNPQFTGKVTVNGDEIAIKSYVDGLISNLVSCAPGIAGEGNPLPTADYKAGQTFRVATAGTYAGQTCEVGDLIIVLNDYNAESASNADFMIIQGNIDGAVTSRATTSIVGELVIFDAVTGKVIKGSGVNIDSLKDVIAKAHVHDNADKLATITKTQDEIIAEAVKNVDLSEIHKALEGKADKSEIPDSYTKAETDTLLNPIKENLNTKVSTEQMNSAIISAKVETLQEVDSKIAGRIGDIPENTNVKEYIDNAVGSGGVDMAAAIAKAKQEAINTSNTYTDTAIVNALTIVEF